jgi:hypothetical protein
VVLNLTGKWKVANWVPLLFDILTGVLFAGGCLLLWLNFGPGAGFLLPQRNQQIRGGSKQERATAGLEAHHFNKLMFEEPQAIVENAAEATPSKQSDNVDMGDLDDVNSYADHIALAMRKRLNQR